MKNHVALRLYYQLNFSRLEATEKHYTDCGYTVKIFRETAVSDKDGVATFYTDKDLKHLEWGGTIEKGSKNAKKKVLDDVHSELGV